MKFRLNLYLVVLMVLVLLLGSCGQQASEGPEPKPPSESATSFNVPTLRGAKKIALSMADSELFIADNFGYESTLYDNQLTLLASNKPESELRQALEDNLLEKGWRLYTDAPMESWKQGSQYLLIDISSNLSQTKIDNLRRSYAMDGLKLGDSLVVLYIMDESKALPNPTETAMAAASQATLTAVAEELNANATALAIERESTATAIAVNQAETATAQALAQAATATAESVQSTVEAEAFIIESTQRAIEAEQNIVSARATSIAMQPILNDLGTEFDGLDSLPDGMKIVREDPTRWDLNTQPGWLHIRGRFVDLGSDNWPHKNVFLYPLRYNNISIITRVDADFDTANQGVGIALTPGDFLTEAYTLRLGIRLGSSEGRQAYAWACKSNGCWLSYDVSFTDQIRFTGPVYLRLDLEGNKYTAFYGENGVDWIYLGEVTDFSAGDNLALSAGGGSYSYSDREFDTYFDFLKFEAIAPEE